ncbi:unnamed protein product [Sphenostylis stenocarpa]|uniref:TIR domain-containing protein n=1 Tax=Sphenostylis stenocarpa TaxID=92480 RepID=A0AA86SDP5_9FABA|nr:unnamed protein product [Sphenostylis stenocarpa]
MEFTPASCDVLINFTGEDIRRKFVSHLDSALSAAGLTTFLQEENLVKTMHIQEQLTQAKEMCRVAIVVFTKTYAESAWCLHELQQIIKWPETYFRHVLPVYYEIQPSDVRLQTNDFGKALKATAQQTFSGQEVEDALSRWSRALTKAANFFGWDESNYRSDAELVDKIIKSVLNLPVLSATQFPIGLQSHVQILIQYIENTKGTCILGIWGSRGVGKATVAKAVYNQIHDILNGCGLHADIGIQVLIKRSLLKIGKNNKLGMHHLLQEMGREIIHRSSTKEREKRNRLFAGDAKFVLTKNNGTEAIQGLVLKSSPLPITSWLEISAFQNKQILRLSDLDSLLFTRDYPNLSKQLRWICHREFPFKHIPENCDMEGVIAIDLKCSNLQRVWKEPWLILKDCPRLCKVHQSIGDLCNLLLINLKDCISLSNLPKEVYKLKSLKTLILSGCAKIDILEEDLVQMESLITLIAEYKAVKQVPFSIGLARSESSDVCLPGDNHPHWLAHVGEGHSVHFTVPKDCDLMGMVLCVVYLSTPENMATECLTSVLIVNYTKCTFQIHKHGTVISFDNTDWEGIISNLGSGDNVEIFVTLAHGFVVKNTAVYMTYGESKKNALHKFIKRSVMCDFK